MAMQAMRANMGLATSFWRAFSLPPANFGSWGKPPRPPRALASKLQKSALGVMEKGIAPIHSKAVANAKRLAKTRLR
jgi:hypothetical protein